MTKAEIAAAELPGELPEEVYFKVLVDSTLSTLMRVHTQKGMQCARQAPALAQALPG